MEIIFRFRGFSFLFYKQWYSTYRWKNPYTHEGEITKLIDFGMISFGYRKKERSDENPKRFIR